MIFDQIKNYISDISKTYGSGIATEHSYRPALKDLFEALTKQEVINETKRSEFGAPDFVIKHKNIIFSYAEAKNIDIDLDEVEKSEQMKRYYGYSSIILTNSLEFRFYKNGQKYSDSIKIAEIRSGEIIGLEENFNLFDKTIKDFINDSAEPIKSGIVLAKLMAGKAIRIRDNIKAYLVSEDREKNKDLLSVYETLKKLLLSDLDLNKFADMYAQTVVYGLFVARYNDETPDNFTRQEARDLVPASNPFLRHFFDHIAGPSFDKRIEWIVKELCEEFNHADVKAIVHNYYNVEKDDSRDPIVHFYEDFLKEYDAKERMKMGVFYTPLPVVRFIVRSIDEILRKNFGLEKGLVDSSKVEIERVKSGKKGKEQVHRVQLLDPATGTGTFLNEVINHIHEKFVGQEGRWMGYVKDDLLPRLNGFELMIASYTIAHLKLSMTLNESGADIGDERIRVFLSNSLEKDELQEETLFLDLGLSRAITDESREANKVKNELPIMVVLGNPPYNISSQNKGEYIIELLKDYKKDLNERKINLDDDYIKFLRFSESLIERNGEGVVAMITNNSFIDGITHRQMRKHLLETFDDIYILDLHGNSKKEEKSPNGDKDENVFNIMQGVSINIFVKKSTKKKGLGNVYHSEIWGSRDDKFDILNRSDLGNTKWKKLNYKEPYFFFVNKDFSKNTEYEKGFSIKDLFNKYVSGLQTKRDGLTIQLSKKEIENVIQDMSNLSEVEIKNKYLLPEDGRDWKISWAIKDVKNGGVFLDINYRPFDKRYTFYTGKTKGFIAYPRNEDNKDIIGKNNLVFLCTRQLSSDSFRHIFISDILTEMCTVSNKGKETQYSFPLYLYSEDGSKMPNFKKETVNEIEKIVGKVKPESILDYIYAVLHSPNYREKYKEFLKIDFPRVSYPKDKKQFDELIRLGEELRHLHLMDSKSSLKPITTYSIIGSDIIEKISYKDDKVYINKEQYFGNVSKIAWDFYVGGYQPAQKWLKDRKGRKLSNSDIEHYQKIIFVLVETDKIMKEIDKIW